MSEGDCAACSWGGEADGRPESASRRLQPDPSLPRPSSYPATPPPTTWRHLDLHVGPTTVRVPMPPSRVAALRGELATLLTTFKEKGEAERPRRWPAMDVVWKGPDKTGTAALTRFEAFCNPNGAAGPFDAKVLVTVETADGVAVTTEAPLAALRADVDAYGL